ncbi:hypothetical protein [Desulfitobacterium chlororespirans]|uniref:Uncharacterized protein n=1 Tax=Desulfitobacterium chlororespirans DSM 11544 TaxID=1121395 RepID=A0A1M7S110_9FIRM|nr:hypothetical protein [Desulfitobacterium chlororespirans]SHN52126.1 hypothetical protein SAMN02745215_00363 [Desulfitobacterium chlororespirans DSM 11544]
MRIKEGFMGLCLLMFIGCFLTGCQLAKEEGSAGGYEDRLVGVFVTTEYLDLFDFAGYVEDNVRSLPGGPGGEIVPDGAGEKYQGRLYAELTKQILTDGVSGHQVEREEYDFPGVEGIAYYSLRVPDSEEGEGYLTTGSDEGISDGHTSLHSSDGGNSVELEGTIYVPVGSGRTYYFNSMYQSADGRVYVTSGSGMSSGGEQSEGGAFTQTMKADYTMTENGTTVKDSISIQLSIRMMYPPEEIVILQMGADSTVVSRGEYHPEEVPDRIITEEETAYWIVETKKRDNSGKVLRTRAIYDREAEYLEAFFCREDGVCIKKQVTVERALPSSAAL